MVATMRDPCRGGLEYMGRIRIFTCDITRAASFLSLQMTENAPALSPEIYNELQSCFLGETTTNTGNNDNVHTRKYINPYIKSYHLYAPAKKVTSYVGLQYLCNTVYSKQLIICIVAAYM